jgi:A nuclease family of the HNH/ENDO VII superfamily with conserved AHH
MFSCVDKRNSELIHEFHLSPPRTGRGVSCDANGAFIGDVPLLKRSIVNGRERWEPRECVELSKAIGASFGLPIDLSSKMGGIRAIANALNEGDVARAQIATVLLRIPDQPVLSKGVHDPAELIDFVRELQWSGLLKADWDPDEHPRWPAGAPDSQGGQFSPKDEDTAASQSTGESAELHQSPAAARDADIPAYRKPFDFDAPSNIQPDLQADTAGLNSIRDDDAQSAGNVSDVEDLGIRASYGHHIRDVQVAATGAITLDGLIGAAEPADWASLTRLTNGALRLGSGQIVTAAALLTAWDMQRERAAVDAAFAKFGFDPTKAADGLAIRAYVWARYHVPEPWWYPQVSWSGPQLEPVSQSIMALELARPGTLGLATQGDEPSKHYLDVAVELGMQGGTIFESRRRPEKLPAALQTTSESARAALNLKTNDQMRAHHLIPVNIWARSPITTLASQGGWQPNSPTNLIPLPADAETQAKLEAEGKILPIHNSNHPNYDGVAAGQIALERAEYKNAELTPAQARAIFEGAAMEMRGRILKREWWPRLY